MEPNSEPILRPRHVLKHFSLLNSHFRETIHNTRYAHQHYNSSTRPPTAKLCSVATRRRPKLQSRRTGNIMLMAAQSGICRLVQASILVSYDQKSLVSAGKLPRGQSASTQRRVPSKSPSFHRKCTQEGEIAVTQFAFVSLSPVRSGLSQKNRLKHSGKSQRRLELKKN